MRIEQQNVMQARHGPGFDAAGVGVVQPNFRCARRSQIVAQLQEQQVPQMHLELFFYQHAQDVGERQHGEVYGAELVDGGGACRTVR